MLAREALTAESIRRVLGKPGLTKVTIKDAVRLSGRHENTWYYRIRTGLIDDPQGLPNTSRRGWEINYFARWENANE